MPILFGETMKDPEVIKKVKELQDIVKQLNSVDSWLDSHETTYRLDDTGREQGERYEIRFLRQTVEY
jgi:hypothetical protein